MTKEGNLVVVDALYSNARIHVFDQSGAIDTFPYEPLRGRYSDSKCRFLAVHGENVLTSDLGKWLGIEGAGNKARIWPVEILRKKNVFYA